MIRYISFKNNNLRILENDDFSPKPTYDEGGKKVYIFALDPKITKIKLLIQIKNENDLKSNPYCLIKYQIGDNFEEHEYKLNEKLTISKENDTNIQLSFQKLSPKNDENINTIIYTAYLYDKIINIDYIHPEFLEKNEKYKVKKEINDTNDDQITVKFNNDEKKDCSIVVLVTVKYNDGNEEYFIYKTEYIKNTKDFNENKRKNDLIFYIIMGSFAFVIILVFIIVFCIINKRKANNPDIDDEEYSNLQIRKEVINDDEF